MKKGEDFIPILCFNSSRILSFYAVFPGQKIFVSLFHPIQALKPAILRGRRMSIFSTIYRAKTIENINSEKCLHTEENLGSVISAHKSYELW